MIASIRTSSFANSIEIDIFTLLALCSITHLKSLGVEYNYEQTTFKIDSLNACCADLSDEGLKKIGLAAKESFLQIALIGALPHFIMTEGIKNIKYFQYSLEGAVATKNSAELQTNEEKKKLNDFVQAKFEANKLEHSEQGRRALNELRAKIPPIEDAIRIQALNSLAHIWTIFESTTKDIWVFLLNNFQSLFLNNILDSKTDSEVEGVNGKFISISLLGKFDFNVNNRLGDILSNKYDFTSCSGIRRAFGDLDKSKTNYFQFLSDQELFRLESIRNLVVHKAGIIDDQFLRKVKVIDQKVGERILISKTDMGLYSDAAIVALIKILSYAEEVKERADKH